MKIAIYQINLDRDEQRAAFESLERMERYGIKFDRSIYDKVFDGDVDARGLEDIFYIFNMEHPAGYRGRSLSVSDVVEINGKHYFCDSFGWEQIDF